MRGLFTALVNLHGLKIVSAQIKDIKGGDNDDRLLFKMQAKERDATSKGSSKERKKVCNGGLF